jgi:hypothetical protein
MVLVEQHLVQIAAVKRTAAFFAKHQVLLQFTAALLQPQHAERCKDANDQRD